MKTNTDLERLNQLKEESRRTVKSVFQFSQEELNDELNVVIDSIVTRAFDLGQMLEEQKHNPRNV